MDIIVSDLVMRNLDSFSEFIIGDFWKYFPREDSQLLKGYVCRSERFVPNLNTIDYKWLDKTKCIEYECTHAFIYLGDNKIHILKHGLDKEKNQKHWDYITDNIPIFERDLIIKEILQ